MNTSYLCLLRKIRQERELCAHPNLGPKDAKVIGFTENSPSNMIEKKLPNQI